MEKTIPTQIENPNGLHQRYAITKIIGYEKTEVNNKWVESITKPILQYPDENAEYFVMRLDTGGKDIEHIKACRIGIHAYAEAIKHHLPELAKDLIERYPLL